MSERGKREPSNGEEERAASYTELDWTAVPGQGVSRSGQHDEPPDLDTLPN